MVHQAHRRVSPSSPASRGRGTARERGGRGLRRNAERAGVRSSQGNRGAAGAPRRSLNRCARRAPPPPRFARFPSPASRERTKSPRCGAGGDYDPSSLKISASADSSRSISALRSDGDAQIRRDARRFGEMAHQHRPLAQRGRQFGAVAPVVAGEDEIGRRGQHREAEPGEALASASRDCASPSPGSPGNRPRPRSRRSRPPAPGGRADRN